LSFKDSSIITWKSFILVEATTVPEADPIPAVFAPIRQLRIGAKFSDLDMHHFTPEEII
jgi:hypothetical protein